MGLLGRLIRRSGPSEPLAPEPVEAEPPLESSAAAALRLSHLPVRLKIVRREGAAPVPGVEVALAGRHGGAVPRATADAEGVVRFLVPPGEYVVAVREGLQVTRRRIGVAGRVQMVLEVEAPTTGREPLVVRVRRRGLPAPQEEVRVLEGPEWAAAVTGADGSCVLRLARGDYRIACAGEEVDVFHRGPGSVLLALEAAAPLADHQWVPAPPHDAPRRRAREEMPFTVARPRPLLFAGDRYEADPPRSTVTARIRVV